MIICVIYEKICWVIYNSTVIIMFNYIYWLYRAMIMTVKNLVARMFITCSDSHNTFHADAIICSDIGANKLSRTMVFAYNLLTKSPVQ